MVKPTYHYNSPRSLLVIGVLVCIVYAIQLVPSFLMRPVQSTQTGSTGSTRQRNVDIDTPPSKVLLSNTDGNISSMNITESYVPPKTIVMWYGTSIPSGWVECNGRNGTPNLSGRFPLAYSNIPNATANKTLGSTGGEERVTLTLDQLPRHQHTGKTDAGGYSTSTKDAYYGSYGRQQDEGSHSHTFTTNPTGGGASHNNMPPYRVLKFIMKQ